MFRRVVALSVVLGAIGPVVLIPVTIWLDLHPHDLNAAMRWEHTFRWLWPTSPMLMSGAGSKPLMFSCLVLLVSAAVANVVLFGLFGALLGGALMPGTTLVRRESRVTRPPSSKEDGTPPTI